MYEARRATRDVESTIQKYRKIENETCDWHSPRIRIDGYPAFESSYVAHVRLQLFVGQPLRLSPLRISAVILTRLPPPPRAPALVPFAPFSNPHPPICTPDETMPSVFRVRKRPIYIYVCTGMYSGGRFGTISSVIGEFNRRVFSKIRPY